MINVMKLKNFYSDLKEAVRRFAGWQFRAFRLHVEEVKPKFQSI
jgi:hypothetical protein